MSTTVIFGGAGFIGSNLACRLLESGERVRVVDNLSRPKVERNLHWLAERFGDRLEASIADVRDERAVRRAVEGVDRVFHFAAQVAVTDSLVQPAHDFEVNARGTLNVLEAIRGQKKPPALLFTSTNKVYGGLPDVRLVREGTRYAPADPLLARSGISEARPLDFESPYGCSKGCADQYVLDWARSYGLRTVVFRMSCIYGPRQFGTEDQGWVAHFLIRALEGEPITLYGDGFQVRDLLFIDDLVRAFRLAMERIDQISGQAFNVGGGPERTVSLVELLEKIGARLGTPPEVRHADWRVGDQRYYVSNTGKLREATGWSPRVDVDEGTGHLLSWLRTLHGPAERSEPFVDRAAIPGGATA